MYLWLLQACNKPGQLFQPARMKSLGLPLCRQTDWTYYPGSRVNPGRVDVHSLSMGLPRGQADLLLKLARLVMCMEGGLKTNTCFTYNLNI